MSTFRFTIALPPDDDYAGLFRALTDQISRYLGLDQAEAERAGAALVRLVSDRLRQAGGTREPVTVAFVRPEPSGPVTVELTGGGVPGPAAVPAGAGLVVEQDGEHALLRLSWTVPD